MNPKTFETLTWMTRQVMKMRIWKTNEFGGLAAVRVLNNSIITYSNCLSLSNPHEVKLVPILLGLRLTKFINTI